MRYSFSMAVDPSGAEVLFDDGVDIERIAIAGIMWLLLIWCMFNAIKMLMSNTALGRRFFHDGDQKPPASGSGDDPFSPPCFTNDLQRESFVMWVVELIVTTWALGIIISNTTTLVHGTFNRALVQDSPDVDWADQTAFFVHIREVMKQWGYGGQPVIFLYLYEIFCASPQRSQQTSHHLLTCHHLIAILLLCFSMKALTMTLNPLWAQMLQMLFCHMIMEQLMWLGLIFYRMRLPFRHVLLVLATAFEIISRFVLWGFCFFVYAKLSFLQCTLSPWEVTWRAAFPILAALMMVAQALVVNIHVQLTKKVWKEMTTTKKTPADNEPVAALDSSSSLSSAVVDIPTPKKQDSANETTRAAAAVPPSISAAFYLGQFFAVFTIVVVGVLYGAEVIPADATIVEVRCKNIAIVGGGASGISSAWSLARDSDKGFKVDVFEATDRMGGAAATVYSPHNGKPTEMGLQYLTDNYDTLMAFMREELGIETVRDPRGIAAAIQDKTGKATNIFNYMADLPIKDDFGREVNYNISGEIRRLEKVLSMDIAEHYSEEELMTTTMKDMLLKYHFSQKFIDFFLMACVQLQITVKKNAYDFAIGMWIHLEEAFGASTVNYKTARDVIMEGTQHYINLATVKIESMGVNVYMNSPVEAIRHNIGAGTRASTTKVSLKVNNTWREYDQVIFAAQKFHVSQIFRHPESTSLSAPKLYSTALGEAGTQGHVTYEEAVAIAHSDEEYLHSHLASYTENGCYNIDGIAFMAYEENETVREAVTRAQPTYNTTYVAHVPTPTETSHCAPNFTLPYAYFHTADDARGAADAPRPEFIHKTFR